MSIKFNAATYADTVRLAGNAFRNADGKSSTWAQESLAAIMLGNLSLLSVAQTLYSEMNPLTAKGKPAAPKEKDSGTISVSSLRGGGDNICKGGDAARKAFDKLQYVVENKSVLFDKVQAFAISGGSLDGLCAAIRKEKASIAKEQADSVTSEGEATVEREGEDTPPTDAAADAPTLTDHILVLNDLLANATSVTDSEQLALVETLRQIERLSNVEADTVAIAA